MPKLNLDLFGSQATPAESVKRVADDEEKPDDPSGTSEKPSHAETEVSTLHSETETTNRAPAVKFVPVGFDREGLLALDDAVLALRRKGYWKASKSGIIRALIRCHKGQLVEVYVNDADRR